MNYEGCEWGEVLVEEGVRDLRVRTKGFALRVISLVGAMPKTMESQVLGRQLIRSGTSVGANYREAYRSRSKAEFIAKIGDCLKELDETSYWLELILEAKIFSEQRLQPILAECDELLAIFTTISKNSKSNS